MQLPDSVRRALRTWLQGFIGVLAIQAAAIMVDVTQGTWVPDLDWLKRVALSAIAAGCIALVSFLQNALEDHTSMPALLKGPSSSGQNPQP